MKSLFKEHVAATINYAVASSKADQLGQGEALRDLMANRRSFEELFERVYGEPAAKQYAEIFWEHTLAAKKVADGAFSNSKTQYDDGVREILSNTKRWTAWFTKYLSLNAGQITTVNRLVTDHALHAKGYIDALAKNNKVEYDRFVKVSAQQGDQFMTVVFQMSKAFFGRKV